jgi:pimeloyl-ACP methyl ester carboxylesterase
MLLGLILLGGLRLQAADINAQVYAYTSSVSQDGNGPLNLVCELNYNDARANAPIAVMMHGYSQDMTVFRANAQRLRDRGFFAISVAMRGRNGSDGVRDSGGLEVYDIYDAIESVKAAFPTLVNTNIIYMTGYSGGGGNTMSMLARFPDTFNAGAAFFGMSDYGYHGTNGWYYLGGTAYRTTMNTDIGDRLNANTNIMDRYHARAANLASMNNPYSEIHLFVNNNETTCPPPHSQNYYSNAVARESFAGEFSNITVHIGSSSLYKDFDNDSVNDANELQWWPHGALTADQQDAGEMWFIDRLLAGQIPKPMLNNADTLFVAGFVKTRVFECWVGDGQDGAAELDYTLSDTNMTFGVGIVSLNKQRPIRLVANTARFNGETVSVYSNTAYTTSFTGGGLWTNMLAHGDNLELVSAGPPALWWANPGYSSVTPTSVVASATLAGTNAAVWCLSGTNNPGHQLEGWGVTNVLGSSVATGLVQCVLSNLSPSTTYHFVFYATNSTAEAAAWSSVQSFSTTVPDVTGPAVSGAFSPADNATGVDVNANLVVMFNENIAVGTGDIVITNLTDGGAATSIAVTDGTQVSISGATLTVNSTASLLAGKAYAVLMGSGVIEDVSGNPFAGITNTTTWNFQTLGQPVAGNPVAITFGWTNATDLVAGRINFQNAKSPSLVKNNADYTWTNPGGGGFDIRLRADQLNENNGPGLVILNKIATNNVAFNFYATGSSTPIDVRGFRLSLGDLDSATISGFRIVTAAGVTQEVDTGTFELGASLTSTDSNANGTNDAIQSSASYASGNFPAATTAIVVLGDKAFHSLSFTVNNEWVPMGNLDLASIGLVGVDPDGDGDGMDDGWETQYFGAAGVSSGSGTDDWDDDGFIDLHEFIAGTNPTNDMSRFVVEVPAGGGLGGDLTLNWAGITSRLYAVEGCISLTNPVEWIGMPGATQMPGMAGTMSYTVDAQRVERFFRVGVRQTP